MRTPIRTATDQKLVLPCERETLLDTGETLSSVRTREEGGFTLIELLVVVSIIGILSSIAVSIFHDVRIRGFNATAQSDLRNAISAQEALASDGGDYEPCAGAQCETSLPGVQLSQNVEITFVVPQPGQLLGTASHAAGDTTYQFDSTVGKIVEQ